MIEARALLDDVARAQEQAGTRGRLPDETWRRRVLELLAGRALSDYGWFAAWGMDDLAEQSLASYRRTKAQLAEIAWRDALEQFAW